MYFESELSSPENLQIEISAVSGETKTAPTAKFLCCRRCYYSRFSFGMLSGILFRFYTHCNAAA
ncbi:hypothetical protein DWW59_00815 [Firmicutes bacterium AF16-15]|nr:hypothetical protein DWW59_00815 [Firmicutes bacterium AF16-15]